jgi:hypothetical protein
MTLGTDRVRLSFNPSANTDVENIKQRTADCIDWCEGKHKELGPNDNERARLLALACTAFEEAAMWAVKAVT